MPEMKLGSVLLLSPLLPHAPLLNGGLGDRFVLYPYLGPLMPPDKGLPRESILPNPPSSVSTQNLQSIFLLSD